MLVGDGVGEGVDELVGEEPVVVEPPLGNPDVVEPVVGNRPHNKEEHGTKTHIEQIDNETNKHMNNEAPKASSVDSDVDAGVDVGVDVVVVAVEVVELVLHLGELPHHHHLLR